MHSLRPDFLIAARPDLYHLLEYLLGIHGYSTATLSDLDRSFDHADHESPPALILDDAVWRERRSNEAFCRHLHDTTRPILYLQSEQHGPDRVAPPPAVASTQILKQPVVAQELLHHARLLGKAAPTRIARFRFDDLELDVSTQRVRRNGRSVNLSPREFLLLKQLIAAPQVVHSREALLKAAWPKDSLVAIRAIDVHIRKIRQALNVRGEPDLIRTVRSVGYALDTEN